MKSGAEEEVEILGVKGFCWVVSKGGVNCTKMEAGWGWGQEEWSSLAAGETGAWRGEFVGGGAGVSSTAEE